MFLLTLLAHALQPTDGSRSPPAPVSASHPNVQARLARQPGWATFTAGEGRGWVARFDERTGAVRTAWGPPLPLGDTSTPAAVTRAVLDRLGATGLVDPATLRARSARHAADTDTWYVELDRLVDGLPVWRGGVSARVRHGALFLVHLRALPDDLARPGPARLDAAAAADALLAEVPGTRPDGVAGARMLPWEGTRGLELRRVWEVHARPARGPERWVALVDAVEGGVLARWDETPHLQGALDAVHDLRTVDGQTATSPLPWARLDGADGRTEWADEAGGYEVDDATTWTTRLTSPWFEVGHAVYGTATFDLPDGGRTLTEADATWDELDNYVFLHRALAWVERIEPDHPVASTLLGSTVGYADGSCNAWYDGTLNFYDAGGDCQSFGRIADVAWHEWGHALHHLGLLGGEFDGAISEGSADFVSALLSHDAVLAPGSRTDGSAVRDLEPDMVYPDDLVGEVHADGLIWGGALWDTWGELLEETGESRADEGEAWTTIATVFVTALRAGPTLETALDEVLAADDDNGDLSDGTPHTCAITAAFGAHGLAPTATPGFWSLGVELPEVLDADTPTELAVSLVDLAPGCREVALAEAQVHWSVDDGRTWALAPLDVTGADATGAMPGLPEGTVVSLFVEARTVHGDVVSAPAAGSLAPWTAWVGRRDLLGCQDFEADDGGYLASSSSGVHDWAWGRPRGRSGDPSGAWSGSSAWGTDLGGQGTDGDYISASRTRLTAPALDTAGAPTVVLTYRRWLTVEDATHDRASLLVNGAPRWQNVTGDGTTATLDADWTLHTVRIDDPGPTLELAWELDADSGVSLGGWNIDDVCLWVPPPEAPPDSAPVAASDPTACGCATGSTGLPSLLPLLLPLLYGARRRPC